MLTNKIISNLRKELVTNIRKEVIQSLSNETEQVIEKMKNDLAITLSQRGVDVNNLQIYFKPDNSNVTVYICGE